MSQTEYLYEIREFLNLPGSHAGAYIIANVEDTKGERGYPYLSLTISDCSRQIHLAFDLDSSEARRNDFHKIDLLINTLTDFRQAMVQAAINQRKWERAEKIRKAAEEEQKDKVA